MKNITALYWSAGIILVYLFGIWILSEVKKYKRRKDLEEFQRLKLPPLADFLKEWKYGWLTEVQIHFMWCNPASNKPHKEMFRFTWITREKLEELHENGIIDKQERATGTLDKWLEFKHFDA